MKMNNLMNVLIVIIVFVSFCESNKYINFFEIESAKNARRTYPGSSTKIQFSDPFFNTESNKKELSSFTRHHVIPFSRLILFFNTALKVPCFYGFVCETMYNLMNFLMDIASTDGQFEDIDIGNTHDNLIMQLIFSSSKKERERLLKQNIDEYDLKRQIHRMFVWFPPNIFIGPTDRSDDPGNEFEIDSKYVIGCRRYENLTNINDLMVTFLKKYEVIKPDVTNPNHEWDADDFALIHKVFSNFKDLLGLSSVPFNSNNWEKSKSKKWQIKKTFLEEYRDYYDVYNREILQTPNWNAPFPDKVVKPQNKLRKKRNSRRSSRKVCTYEEIERQIKSSINNTCVPKNPRCACF